MSGLFLFYRGGKMAITKLKTRHANGTRSVKQVIKNCLDYDKNIDKTDNGKHISSYACSPETAVDEWLTVKAIYEKETGRTQPKERDIISYFLLQSFKPDEITPQEANALGYKLAMEFTGGNHQFVVCTHTDREHIHNHIEFNSTSLECDRKFRNVKDSYLVIQKINDKICKDYGLSVVENPTGKGKTYGEYREEKQGTSYKAEIRKTIDRLIQTCSTLDELYEKLRLEDYTIKIGKYISIKGAGSERFTRTKTLGANYTEQALEKRIDDIIKAKKHTIAQPTQAVKPPQKDIRSLIDITVKMASGKGKGFERWAKIYNLKEYAKTYNKILEKGLNTTEDLAGKVDILQADFDVVADKMNKINTRMKEIGNAKHHIYNYAKTRDIYKEYKERSFSENYRNLYPKEIEKHLEARDFYKSLGTEKPPKISDLQAEYEELLAQKKELLPSYKSAKNELLEYKIVKENIEMFLKIEQNEKQKKKKDVER